MGQKINPNGIRLGIVTDWTSKWYADSKNYPDLLVTDLQVRDFLKKKLSQASVSRIQIDRPAKNAHITVHTARPGLVIGKKGEDIDALRIVADGVNALRSPERAMLLVTHYQRLLGYIEPDFVHVLAGGRIVRSGDKSLALELEEKGYSWLEEAAA